MALEAVAPEAIARSEAAETGLAEERRPAVVNLGEPLGMTPISFEVPDTARGECRVSLRVLVVTIAIRRARVLVMPWMPFVGARAVVEMAFFGARSPLTGIGRCGRGSRQKDRGQSHHRDGETRSALEKPHVGPPVA